MTNWTKASIFICSLCLIAAVEKHDFRYISNKDLQPFIHHFPLDGVNSYSQMLFDVSRDQLFIGARDSLFRLRLSKLEMLEAVQWNASPDKRRSCTYKGQDEENCHNFIKILLSNGNQILACGTNAFAPLCSWRNIDNLSNVTDIIDGIAKCPYNPAASVTGFISDNLEYFFAGTTDFSSSDFLISKNINGSPLLRTKQYNSFWLNDPEFVGSFETNKFAYFLFRETAVEYINCGKVVYSRIARVCKNDSGGNTVVLKDNWTTFTKARLNCSISGDYPFYYNEIQNAHFITEENMLYATFTTPSNGIPGSAICAFNMSAIDEAFDGPFKYQNDMNSAWTSHEVPNRDHLECRSGRPNNLLETSKYQLMDNAVQATTLNPLYFANQERFTEITIDIVKNKHFQNIHIIYVATQEGIVKKLTVFPRSKSACVVEVWQIASSPSLSIQNMQFLKETNSIYAIIDGGLIKIPADQCQRHTSRESCLNAMDPYCGWNELVDKCTKIPEGAHHKYWKQLLNSCPILNTPINGGWSSWSHWQPCYHRISSDGENDHCLCQTRQCDNPSPANDGLPCSGEAVAVTNCTTHGGWSDWSAWSACSATCGTAVKTRFRTCSNPAPAFGGRVCVGQDRSEAFCAEIPPCPQKPTNGGWSSWSSWSSCSSLCGGGFRFRQRQCDNPTTKNGGHYCKGNDIEYEKCNEHICKDHKQWISTEWITDYNITNHQFHQKRYRITCKASVKHAQQIKIFVKDENQICHSNRCETEDSDHNGWSSWSNWGECSASCNGGTQSRSRHCFRGNGCIGESMQTRDCNKHSCEDSWGCWTEWSPCNVSCGWGVRTRYRECLGQQCRGVDSEKQACHDQPCENILGWSNWTEWSECDDNGLQYRKRSCFLAGPHMCQGEATQSRMCIGEPLTNDIGAYGVMSYDCSCFKSNLSLFFLGLIMGISPIMIYLVLNTVRRKKHRVPSSPHYITELNPYIAVPVRDKSQLKKQHSYNGNGTIKSKFDFDFVPTLKKHSSDLRNGNTKSFCGSDKHLYE